MCATVLDTGPPSPRSQAPLGNALPAKLRFAGGPMTRSRYRIYEQSHPHFLTCTVVAWLPIFTRRETVQIILDSWRFLQKENRLVLYGYVILENHMHLIASAPNLSKTMKEFKSFTALRLLDCLK